jgi:hypothetical protein
LFLSKISIFSSVFDISFIPEELIKGTIYQKLQQDLEKTLQSIQKKEQQ